MFLISGGPCPAIKTLKAEQGRRDFSLPPTHPSHLYLWLSFFHFCTTAPIISGPDDFQYYVTTTEFTEEAILMRVEVSDPRLPWTLGNLRCLAFPLPACAHVHGQRERETGLPGMGRSKVGRGRQAREDGEKGVVSERGKRTGSPAIESGPQESS